MTPIMRFYIRPCEECFGSGLNPLDLDALCPDCQGYGVFAQSVDLRDPWERIICADIGDRLYASRKQIQHDIECGAIW